MRHKAARVDRKRRRDMSSSKRMGATKVVVIKNSQFIPRVPPIRRAVSSRGTCHVNLKMCL